jgi:uncharacterized phage-associated protein
VEVDRPAADSNIPYERKGLDGSGISGVSEPRQWQILGGFAGIGGAVVNFSPVCCVGYSRERMPYNEEKATAVAAFFLEKAGGTLEDLKLMKLMYISEREALRVRGSGITGDRFYSMKNGPIMSHTLDRMTPRDQIDPASVWREHIGLPEQWLIRLIEPYNVEKTLSDAEREILSGVWDKYGALDKWALVNISHGFREWHDPGDSSRPISLDEIYVALGFSKEEINARLSAHKAEELMDQAIAEAETR